MRPITFGLATVAFLGSVSLSRPLRAESETNRIFVVTVSPDTPELDEGALRGAIGRELQGQTVGPNDERAARAQGRLDVSIDRPTHEIVVTYRGGPEPLVRRVDLPGDRAATTRVVAALAGNLGRNEAGELAASLRAPPGPPAIDPHLPEHDEPKRDGPTREGEVGSILARDHFELRPLAGWAVAPNSATGGFVGADVAYRFGGFFGLGADFAWYSPFNGSAAPTSTYPLNEVQWSSDLEAYAVPWPGRAAVGRTIGPLEPYALGGLGLLASRPIALVDPVNRRFSDNLLIDLCVGVGLRVFVAERTAITLEVRDLMYFEKLESSLVAPGGATTPLNSQQSPANPATWYSPTTRFTHSVQFSLGASFFVL